MMPEEEINGVNTIQEIIGAMPKELEIPFNLQKRQTTLQPAWNATYIAIIPYCFKCKIPLVWHIHPENVLFHCPKCRARWIKGEGWSSASPQNTT